MGLKVVESTKRITEAGEEFTDVAVEGGGGLDDTATHGQPPGVDALPLPDDYAITVEDVGTGNVLAVGYIDPDNKGTAVAGEFRVYARNSSGAVVCDVHLKADGTVVVNGGTESAVKGDTFKTTYDAHTHSTAFGPSGPPAVPYPAAGLNSTVKV
jgi:hypothetical protein